VTAAELMGARRQRAPLGVKDAGEEAPLDELGPPCPKCAAVGALAILRGMPTPETFERVRRGEVVLGGCVVRGDGTDPQWWCRACGLEFRAEGASSA
jgi:hypothetical protein